MGVAISILTSLGVDYTVFIQLTIFVLFFPAMRSVCLLKMGKVLATRRELGIEVANSALELQQNEILRLNQEYDQQVNDLYRLAHQKLQQQKQELEKILIQDFNQEKKALEDEMEKKRQSMNQEIANLRVKMQKEKKFLIQPLLEKFDY